MPAIIACGFVAMVRKVLARHPVCPKAQRGAPVSVQLLRSTPFASTVYVFPAALASLTLLRTLVCIGVASVVCAARWKNSLVPADVPDGAAEVYRACFSPGSWLVWGPGVAGTLARAAVDLAGAGKRVSLPGRELRQIQRRLAELSGVAAEITALTARLGDFDVAEYVAARVRIDNEAQLAQVATSFREAERDLCSAARKTSSARSISDGADEQWRGIADEREALTEAHRHAMRLRVLELRRDELEAKAVEAEVKLGRVHGRRATRRAGRALAVAEYERDHFAKVSADDRLRLIDLIVTCRARARPVTEAAVRAARDRLAAARADLDQADREETVVRRRVRVLREQADEIAARGLADERDHDYVGSVRAAGLPSIWERRELLVRQQRSASAEQAELEQLCARLTGEEADVVLVENADGLRDVFGCLRRAMRTAVLCVDRPGQENLLARLGIVLPGDAPPHAGCVELPLA